jgi:hypothetical protein
MAFGAINTKPGHKPGFCFSISKAGQEFPSSAEAQFFSCRCNLSQTANVITMENKF